MNSHYAASRLVFRLHGEYTVGRVFGKFISFFRLRLSRSAFKLNYIKEALIPLCLLLQAFCALFCLPIEVERVMQFYGSAGQSEIELKRCEASTERHLRFPFPLAFESAQDWFKTLKGSEKLFFAWLRDKKREKKSLRQEISSKFHRSRSTGESGKVFLWQKKDFSACWKS